MELNVLNVIKTEEKGNTKCLTKDFKTPQIKVKKRSSFFNLENSNEDRDCNTKQIDEYSEKLKKEADDWMNLIQKTNSKIKELSSKEKKVCDLSMLSAERRDYLNQAVNVNEYLKGYQEFANRVLFYVKQKEWIQMRLQYCQEQLSDSILDAQIESLSTRDSLPSVARPQ